MIKNTTTDGLQHVLIIIVTLLLLVSKTNGLTAPPILAPTNRYVNISTIVFSTANSFGTGLTKLQPLRYTHTFPYTKANTNYRVGVSVAQITYAFPNNRALNYSLDVQDKTTSNVGIWLFTNNPKSISVFPGFMGLYFNYFYTSYGGGSSMSNGQSISQTWTGSIAATTVSSSTIFSSLIGVDLFAGSTLQVGLSVKASLTSTTNMKIVVTALSPASFTLNAIYVLCFVFDNSKLLLVLPSARYSWASFSDNTGQNSNLLAPDTKNIVRSFNTIIGLTSFLLKDPVFDYKCIINPSLSVAATSASAWSTFGFNYLVFQFYYCADTTPYLMVSTNTCYDICPARYCSNGTIFQCNACPTVDCYYCGVNRLCTTCNDTLDFRYLNTTTMRCLPLPGYYETNLSAAAPCVAANCLTCTSATLCLSCYVGKYLTTAKTCLNCIADCYNCTAASSCVTCNTNFIYASPVCVPNCSNITNCNTCTANSTTVTCLNCQAGYSLVNNTCIQVCGDGMVMTPELCDDGNLVSGDGCSSTCTIETAFYCNITVVPSLCGICVVSCDNCTNSTVCTLCSIGYVLVNGTCSADCSVIANCSTCSYNSSISLANCLSCQLGYTIQSNACTTQCGDGVRVSPQGCDDGATNSGDGCSSNCTVETGYFCADTYPNASVCEKCADFCSVCTDNSTCITCNMGYIYNGSACIIDCSSVENCSACVYNTSVECTNCTVGYQLNNSTYTCQARCGDGVRVSPQACDDGGTTNGDGCSDNCTVEIGYYCLQTYPNVSLCTKCLDFCSVCSDNLTCTTCNPGYAINGSACTIDCSPIINCSTCNYNGTTQCTICVVGYDLAILNNTCSPRCGDGVRVALQDCDDGGVANGDGCSSNCTIEIGYHCADSYPNASICGRCLDFCSVCSNNLSCTACYIGYTYNGTYCTIDCSPITNCSSCDYNGTTKCTNCTLGYDLNSASNTCSPRCGDGIKLSTENCDDGGINNGDGCSSNCTVETGFYCIGTYPNASVCARCLDFCSVCNDNSTCVSCNVGYFNNATVCTIDCSPIVNCSLCIYNSSTQCTECALGYHLINSSNICVTQCGDGYRNGNESCDDNNTANNDGCSSTCTLQATFYCSDIAVVGGVQSNCSSCVPFCAACVNGSACDQCLNSFFVYSPSNISCDINCSSIAYCTTCNYTAGLSCLSCSLGYYLNANNSCESRCGDAILVFEQICDDGNTESGDGCSSACVLEQSFFCSNTTSNGTSLTVCTKCLVNCLNCSTDANDCVECVNGYLYNFQVNATCDADCGIFLDCAACSPTQCLTCRIGYTLSNSNCIPICGDGMVLIGQFCDDNNTVSSDGCSNNCQVQSNFQCNTVSGISVCSLLSWSLDFVSLFKVPQANSVSIQYQINPSTLVAFSSLDWSTVVYQQSNLSLSFRDISYDGSTGQLTINADYAQNLNYQLLQIGFNFPPTAPFELINATNTSTVLVSSNNLSLEVYSDETYANSKILEYLAMGSSILASVLFILGYFSGKLIGLECVTVFQLTFLSLLTFEDLSPSFGALSKLSYSCGYNIKTIQTSNVKIGRRFNPINYSEPFLSNYNVTAIVFVIPLVVSLVLALINRFKYDLKDESLTKYSRLFRGQYTFLGLMFSAYGIILSLGIQIRNIGLGMIGLAIGALLILIIIVYGVLLHKMPQIFGEFTQKFQTQSCIQSHYYCLMICERIVTTACLLLILVNPQGAVIIIILLLQIFVVLYSKPYKGQRAWLRPFLNLLISSLIMLIFMLNPIVSKSMAQYNVYAPFAVIIMLIACLAYNIYFWIKSCESKPSQKLEQKDEQSIKQCDLMKEQFKKLNLFKERLIKSRKWVDTTQQPENFEEQAPQSPSKLSGKLFNSVRDQLRKNKLVNQDASNIMANPNFEEEI